MAALDVSIVILLELRYLAEVGISCCNIKDVMMKANQHTRCKFR
jgi:hypothetical protein